MKYITYLLLFLTLITSCTKDEEYATTDSRHTAYATANTNFFDTNTTRAYLDSEGSTSNFFIKWSPEDAISIFDGKYNNKFTITDGSGTTYATFYGECRNNDNYMSFCPFQESLQFNPMAVTICNVKLKNIQAASELSSDSECTMMSSYSDTLNFHYKNINSYIEITPDNIPNCKELRFLSNAGEALVGTVSVDAATGELSSDITDGSSIVTIVGAESDKTYHFALFPTVLSKGFTVEIVTDDAVYKRKSSKTLTLKRNNNLNLGKLTSTNCQMIPIHKSLYYKIMDNVLYIRATPKDGYSERVMYEDTELSKNGWYLSPNRESITKAVIEEPVYPAACTRMFDRMGKMQTIENFEYLNVENSTSEYCMFQLCSEYTGNDMSAWNVGKSKNMKYMFSGCQKMTSIGNISNWNVSNITSTALLFYNCKSLQTIGNLDDWKVSKVTDMMGMFEGCNKLENIGELDKWDVSNVTDMSYMFNNCYALGNIGNLKDWNVSKVTTFSLFLSHAHNISTIGDLSGWDVGNVTDMSGMFQTGTSQRPDGLMTNEALAGLKYWNVSKVKNFTSMFYGQGTNLTQLDLSNWDTSSGEGYSHMFADCEKLQSLDLSKWNMENCLCTSTMFNDCLNLTTIGDISGWRMPKVITISCMFQRCRSLEGKIDLSGITSSNIHSAVQMFEDCNSIEEIDLRNLITLNFNTSFEGMGVGYFYSTNGLPDVPDDAFMNFFYGTKKLKKVWVGPGWITEGRPVSAFSNMWTNSNISEVTRVIPFFRINPR